LLPFRIFINQLIYIYIKILFINRIKTEESQSDFKSGLYSLEATEFVKNNLTLVDSVCRDLASFEEMIRLLKEKRLEFIYWEIYTIYWSRDYVYGICCDVMVINSMESLLNASNIVIKVFNYYYELVFCYNRVNY